MSKVEEIQSTSAQSLAGCIVLVIEVGNKTGQQAGQGSLTELDCPAVLPARQTGRQLELDLPVPDHAGTSDVS